MEFSEKMVATRELRSGIETTPIDVTTQTLIRPGSKAVGSESSKSEFNFSPQNIAEDPDSPGPTKGMDYRMISRSDLGDARNSTVRNYNDNRTGSLLFVRKMDLVQLGSRRYVHIESVDDCVVVELQSPLIEEPVVIPESEIDGDVKDVATELRDSVDVCVQLTEQDNLELSFEREPKYAKGTKTITSLFMASNSETVKYNVELPDSKMMFEEDVYKQKNKERTVTFQVRDDGNDTRLIADELDEEWTFDGVYNSDLARFFESVGFEKIDNSRFTAVVRRSSSSFDSDCIASDSGEWVLPTNQGLEETEREMSKSYN